MSIELSEAAIREIKHISEQQNLDLNKTFLRIGVQDGGCSGLSYMLDLTENITEQDERFDNDGVAVVCDSRSMQHLKGTTIDFKDEAAGRGFVFNNPNPPPACGGCQSSCNA